MNCQRRDFLKASALAAATAVAHQRAFGASSATDSKQAASGIKWDKAPCRFCGTGCHVQVGVENDKVVAIQGDQKAGIPFVGFGVGEAGAFGAAVCPDEQKRFFIAKSSGTSGNNNDNNNNNIKDDDDYDSIVKNGAREIPASSVSSKRKVFEERVARPCRSAVMNFL